MAEELQGLLDRIQKEGVERADAEAGQIIADAKVKAKTLLSDAQKESAVIIEKAKADSELFRKRSESAIGQAARDIILSVGEAVTETMQAIVNRNVNDAMSIDALPEFIHEAVKAYSTANGPNNISVLLSEKQKDAVTALFMKAFGDDVKSGLTIKSSHGIISGFQVTLGASGVQHDFTGEALTEAIGKLLRPQLAEIVNNALQKKETPARS